MTPPSRLGGGSSPSLAKVSGVYLSWLRRKEDCAKADQAAMMSPGKLVAAFHNDPILSALLPTTISSSTILCWVEARQPGQPAPAPAPIPASAPAVAPAPTTYQTAGGLPADGPAPMVGGSASADDPPALYPHLMPVPRRPLSTASMPGVL